MKDPVFDRKHIREYAVYGGIAGILYAIPVWYFLKKATYLASGVVYIGTILFMFAIFAYHLKLIKRHTDYQSAWRMIVAGLMTVLVGVIVSVVLATLLCFIYVPGFTIDNKNNIDNFGALQIIILTATIANFGTGSFISILSSYVIKPNQTEDTTPSVLQDEETTEPSSNVVHHPNITH